MPQIGNTKCVYNVLREWSTTTFQPWCMCGWHGRRRKISAANRMKMQGDIVAHAKKCRGPRHA